MAAAREVVAKGVARAVARAVAMGAVAREATAREAAARAAAREAVREAARETGSAVAAVADERVECGWTALRLHRTCREARSNQRELPARRGPACLVWPAISLAPQLKHSCAPPGHWRDTRPARHDRWRSTLAP